MPQIVVTQPFSWAHHGYQIEHFEPAPQPREAPEDCAAVACREGWAHLASAPEAAATAAAPENRDAARKPRARKES